MQTSKSILVRASALAAVLGALLWDAKIIYMIYESNSDRAYHKNLTDDLLFVVPLLLLAGLAGLYVHCRGRLGERENLALAGFVLGSVGLAGASVSSGLWALGLVSDVLRGLLGGLLFVAIGLLMLGGSIIHVGLLGRWKAVPLLVGIIGILAVAMPPWNSVGVTAWALFGLAWAVLGHVLWIHRNSSFQQAALTRRRAQPGQGTVET
ncbi:MAG: hypothetical protein M3151_05680 [Actinomycetota bacterium]|nr:hypothetical protein [Actinomycetota bacterium]